MLYRLKIEISSEQHGEICVFMTSSEQEKPLIELFNEFGEKIIEGSKERWGKK